MDPNLYKDNYEYKMQLDPTLDLVKPRHGTTVVYKEPTD